MIFYCASWKVDRGDKILFWHDNWIDSGCLKDWSPQMYAIAQTKNMRVVDAGEWGLNRNVWAVNVIRNLNGWKVEEYKNVLNRLANVQLNQSNDKLV